MPWNGQSEKMKEYRNSQIEQIINEYIHSERDRSILKARLIDGLTNEQNAEKHDLSVRQICNIIYKNEQIVFKHV